MGRILRQAPGHFQDRNQTKAPEPKTDKDAASKDEAKKGRKERGQERRGRKTKKDDAKKDEAKKADPKKDDVAKKKGGKKDAKKEEPKEIGRPFTSVVFSPDNQKLYAGNLEGIIKIYDVASSERSRRTERP